MAKLSLLEQLIGLRSVRRAADAVLVRAARRRVAFLDQANPVALQQRILARLIRYARDTHFGRAHGFEFIRTVRNYQDRVPLRDFDAFWQEYWQPVFPEIVGATWPEPVPYFALSSGTTTGTTKHIPVSRQMVASNQKAAMTLSALYRATYPEARLLTGQLFFLGGSTDLKPITRNTLCGDLSGIAAHEALPGLNAYIFPPASLALVGDWEQKVELLAEQSARLPITLISGVPAWLLTLFDRLRQRTGKEHIAEIWPTLRVVVHGGCMFEPYRPTFREVLGDERIHLVDTYPCSEGYVATEDPRYGLLRLIPDHGIFFEFVPVAELGFANPTRHTVADLELGVQYAVIVTTCAGLWSYILGDTVAFERRRPPLFRFTGRTKYTLSAFGEHLISEEIEKAVARAADRCATTVRDFHVGPVFPKSAAQPGCHRYLIEFLRAPQDLPHFRTTLDTILQTINDSYRDYRVGDVSLAPPEVLPVPPGGFAAWMRSRGKAGGQHKVPRIDGSGKLTEELSDWLATWPGETT